MCGENPRIFLFFALIFSEFSTSIPSSLSPRLQRAMSTPPTEPNAIANFNELLEKSIPTILFGAHMQFNGLVNEAATAAATLYMLLHKCDFEKAMEGIRAQYGATDWSQYRFRGDGPYFQPEEPFVAAMNMVSEDMHVWNVSGGKLPKDKSPDIEIGKRWTDDDGDGAE